MCISVDQNLLVLLNNSKILNEVTIERFKQMDRIVNDDEVCIERYKQMDRIVNLKEDNNELKIIKQIEKLSDKLNTDQ